MLSTDFSVISYSSVELVAAPEKPVTVLGLRHFWINVVEMSITLITEAIKLIAMKPPFAMFKNACLLIIILLNCFNIFYLTLI